jgi:hypothetical protein
MKSKARRGNLLGPFSSAASSFHSFSSAFSSRFCGSSDDPKGFNRIWKILNPPGAPNVSFFGAKASFFGLALTRWEAGI